MSGISYEFARCVVCGHTDAEVIATSDDLRVELEELWAYHGRRLKATTPVSRLMDRVAFSEPPALQLVRCRECGLVYRNPMERAFELRDIYAKQETTRASLRALHARQRAAFAHPLRVLRALMGRGAASISGLEIGSYVGAFLAAARDEGFAFEGVDVNADANDFVRSLGFRVADGDLGALPADRAFDVVAIWNTFDQLENPRATLMSARQHVRADGVLAIRVPNGAFYARLCGAARRGHRPAVAALAQNNLLTFPYRWGFTPRSLAMLLRESGFTVRRVRPDVLVPIADEWTRRWARVEERVIKRVVRGAVAARLLPPPWFEVYASMEPLRTG